MSVSVGKNVKNCITCAYWTGPRKPSIIKNVEVLGNRKGICLGNTWNGKEMRYDSSCQDWKLWGVLE